MTTSPIEPGCAGEIVRDELVLRLRDEGRTYLAIANEVGLVRAAAARESYLRAVRRRSPQEQRSLCGRELQRLDALAAHVAERKDLDEQEVHLWLEMVDGLRHDLKG
jgi:hypothetical protein